MVHIYIHFLSTKPTEPEPCARFRLTQTQSGFVETKSDIRLGLYIKQQHIRDIYYTLHITMVFGYGNESIRCPAATENLRETNVELREENPKTSPENLINTFCGAP